MIVVIPFCDADAQAALTLVEYIGQLGGCQDHDVLLVADAGVNWDVGLTIKRIAEQSFKSTTLICTEESISGWPAGANALWLEAARYCHSQNTSFLWLEPDAIPVKRGWLVSIEKMKGSGYFGHIYDCQQDGLPLQLLSGVAVYPADAITLIGPCLKDASWKAWDVASAGVVLRHAISTKLIQHFWGERELPPTFVEVKSPNSPRNAFTLDDIWPETVVFHRNKDGSLISLLRRKMRLAAPGNFVVVLPFCNLDVNLLIKNLTWMKVMGMPKSHDCLLSYDRATNGLAVREVKARATEAFCVVHQTSYSVPAGTRFPQTAAWQHAAHTMQKLYRNWLWLEADAIPLKKQWLDVLQNIYDTCRMPFAGPMVQGASHCNGTPTIYPANTPELLPRTMSHTENAWDMEAAEEMRGKTKDIGHIAVAMWGVKDGRLNPLEGEAPSFPPGSPLIHQIPKTAVVFHRDKGGSLIDRLST